MSKSDGKGTGFVGWIDLQDFNSFAELDFLVYGDLAEIKDYQNTKDSDKNIKQIDPKPISHDLSKEAKKYDGK